MKIVLGILFSALVAVGCGKTEKAAPQPAPSPLDTMMEGATDDQKAALEMAKVISDGQMATADRKDKREAELAASIKKDKNAVMFPLATKTIKDLMEQSIGTNVAAKGTITPERVEDFGDSKWEVTGTYHGPDRRGKIFASKWNVEIQERGGFLFTGKLDLGKPEFDQ